MYITENLGIEWDETKRIRAPNRSGIYWGIFDEWWNNVQLFGNVLSVGDEYPQGTELKSFLSNRFPMIDHVYINSLSNSDLDWDITQPLTLDMKFDWIICQAVLEHVIDPVAAVYNMVATLDPHRFIMLHSHGPGFPEHRHPIDCYRFFRDGVVALANHADLTIIDMLWTNRHWFLFGKKGEQNG
jgi:hypothetical protein